MRLDPAAMLLALSVSVPVFLALGTPPDGNMDMDSVAIWDAPDARESLVLATDKVRDRIEIHHVASNTFVGTIGSSGSGPGQLQRPNGIAVGQRVQTGSGLRDIVFVVERDNDRVSMFSFPAIQFLGSFGTSELRKPYGLALHQDGDQTQVWVTSTGTNPERVVIYDLLQQPGGSVQAQFLRSFPAAGVLESIVIDPVWRHAIVCDESQTRNINVYDFDGNLLHTFGSNVLTAEAEGVVIYDLGGGEGYIIATDQFAVPTQYEIFDRRTFEWLGSFSGTTMETDGVALTQRPRTGLNGGSFYAINANRNVHVYDWNVVAAALGLQTRVIRGVTDVPSPAVESARLWSAPNPARGSATIAYRLAAAAPVCLEVFDLAGRRVARLMQGVQPAGEHQVLWQARDAAGRRLPAGLYLTRLRLEGREVVHKVLLVD